LNAFQSLPVSGKKVVVFADMRELGVEEKRFHRELGEKILASGVDVALAYGNLARFSIEAACAGMDARHFGNSAEVFEALRGMLKPGDSVLFKGSRSMHVEKVLEGVRSISFVSQP